jgi:SLBB domain.
MGASKKPGFYLLPDDTDLLTLLSLAGGPTGDAKLSKVRIVRPSQDNGQGEIIWVNLKKYLDTGNYDIIPVLKAGDTVVVSGTIFYGMERVAGFLAKFATVLSIYNLYLTIQNK